MPGPSSRRARGLAGWAVGLLVASFLEAVWRLGLRAADAVRQGLSPVEWLAFAALVVAFAWFEGYRALHLRFAPQVVRRALALDGVRWAWLTGPFFIVSLFGDERRRVVRAWVSAGLIVLAAVSVSLLPHPWRGLIDGAVACALLLGAVSLCGRLCVALAAKSVTGGGSAPPALSRRAS